MSEKKSAYASMLDEFGFNDIEKEKQAKIEAQKKRNSELDAIHKKLDMIIALLQNLEGTQE